MHPILFRTPWVTVYTYGFFVALAVLAAFFISMRRAESFDLSKNTVADLIFFLFIFGVLGARLFYALQHFEDYKDNGWRVFFIQEGGLVWYGGFIAAVGFGVAYALTKGLPLLALCDFFSPVLALAHAIGRIGCFFNGCCFGREARPPLGVFFGDESVAKIPTQAYEAGFLLLFSIFLFRSARMSHKAGEVFLNYIIGYSAFRFGIEFLRGDQSTAFFLTIPQWMSIFFFCGAVFLWRIIRKKA